MKCNNKKHDTREQYFESKRERVPNRQTAKQTDRQTDRQGNI